MDWGAVILALFIAFVVKVVVMFLGAQMVLRVYQATYQEPPRRLWILLPRQHLPEIRILWWSLVLFFIAEITCGVEVFILFRSSPILSGTHAIVSAVGMMLFALGTWLYLDKKIFHYGEPGCLGNYVCDGCTVHDKEGCKFLLVILLGATFVVMGAFQALFAPTDTMFAQTRKYLLSSESLNAWFTRVIEPWLQEHLPNYVPSGAAYYLPSSMFVIEFRILPAITAILAVIGIVFLRTRRERLGIRFTAVAFGILCYTYLEIILYPATGDVLLGSLGHEVVELWFLMITAEFLRRSFRPDAAMRPETAP